MQLSLLLLSSACESRCSTGIMCVLEGYTEFVCKLRFSFVACTLMHMKIQLKRLVEQQ